MHDLGYPDGQLNNIAMLEVADKISAIVRSASGGSTDSQIEFITFDLNGLTGHIDHIVASRATMLAFYRLKADDTRISRLRLACLPRHLYPSVDTTWLYMDAGRTPEEIDETVDARDQRHKIIEIIRAHHSQRQDGDAIIQTFGDTLGMNYFIVKE